MGRLDAVVAPVIIVALAIALNHPRIASSLLTAAAWVKVAPGALLLSMFFAVRRPWRSVVVPGALVSRRDHRGGRARRRASRTSRRS